MPPNDKTDIESQSKPELEFEDAFQEPHGRWPLAANGL